MHVKINIPGCNLTFNLKIKKTYFKIYIYIMLNYIIYMYIYIIL